PTRRAARCSRAADGSWQLGSPRVPRRATSSTTPRDAALPRLLTGSCCTPCAGCHLNDLIDKLLCLVSRRAPIDSYHERAVVNLSLQVMRDERLVIERLGAAIDTAELALTQP